MPTFGPTIREYYIKPKFSKVQAIYKEINKAHLIVGIDMHIQAIQLPLISGFSLDKFHK
jgi:hypothetical protein